MLHGEKRVSKIFWGLLRLGQMGLLDLPHWRTGAWSPYPLDLSLFLVSGFPPGVLSVYFYIYLHLYLLICPVLEQLNVLLLVPGRSPWQTAETHGLHLK